MTVSVELVWEPDCPNVEAARETVREALRATGLPESWTEWEIGSDTLPDHARGFGSPTILVNEQEVTGHGGGGTDDCCRVYLTDQGYSGVPTVDSIVSRLKEAGSQRTAG